jgi:hypothetical protein
MEGQLALAKVTLLEQEEKLKELVHEKNKIREQYDRTNNSDNSLKKVLRNKDHDIRRTRPSPFVSKLLYL